jgi:translation initiation factor IF-2
MKKRVHEIAKEQGMSPKVALARMQAAGMKVGAASSSVDEETALRVLSGGGVQTAEAEDLQSPAANGGATAADAGDSNGGKKATGRRQPAAATGANAEGATAAKADGATAAKADGATAAKAEGTKRPAAKGAGVPPAPTPKAAAPTPTSAPTPESAESAGDGAGGAAKGEGEPGYKRPTRDSLQGERAPGAAGGRGYQGRMLGHDHLGTSSRNSASHSRPRVV